jgi:uncharacterized protein (DUF2147 family)
MRTTLGLLLAASMSTLAGAAFAVEPAAAGFWVTPDHGAVVNITPCDSGLCGHIVGLRTDRNPTDIPKDDHNPDPTKRGNPRCGLVLMGGLKPVKGSTTEWEDGWVYDPESGHTFTGEMHLEGPDTLKLRGYLGISLLGQTQVWTRETGETKNRCTIPGNG